MDAILKQLVFEGKKSAQRNQTLFKSQCLFAGFMVFLPQDYSNTMVILKGQNTMSLVPWLCLGRDGLKNMESRFYCSFTIHEVFFACSPKSNNTKMLNFFPSSDTCTLNRKRKK